VRGRVLAEMDRSLLPDVLAFYLGKEQARDGEGEKRRGINMSSWICARYPHPFRRRVSSESEKRRRLFKSQWR
jgi:hypothetical protein